MSKKEKSNKHEVVSKVEQSKDLPLFQTNKVTFWSETEKRHLSATLEVSLKDTMVNWDNADYGVSKAVYEDNSAGVNRLMKENGYKLLYSKPQNGCYFFQHYTRKSK